MSFTVAISAGLAVAATVGPAREWRGTVECTIASEPVNRSCLITTENGARGGIAPVNHYEGPAEAHVNMGRLGENMYQNGRAVHIDSSLWREPVQTRVSGLGRLEKAALARNLVRASLGHSHQSHPSLTMEELRQLDLQIAGAFCREGYCRMGLGAKDLLGRCDLVPDPQSQRAPDPLLVGDDNQVHNADVARFTELMAQDSASKADAFLIEYTSGESSDSAALVLLGLRQIKTQAVDAGLKTLSRASQVLAPVTESKSLLVVAGVTELQLADLVVRLMNQKSQLRSMDQALGMATAAHLAGRSEAAKRLLDQAVQTGFDRSEAAVLTEMWGFNR